MSSLDPSSSSHPRQTLYRQPSYNTLELAHEPEPPNTPTVRYERSNSPTRPLFGEIISGGGGGGKFSVGAVGRVFVARIVRAGKRGNLPFLVVFMSCLIIFFSALAGIGYVDPETTATSIIPIAPPVAADFVVGAPVFDMSEEQLRKVRSDEQRALEMQWAKKKRPKDGAWMKSQRDDKAVRRKKAVEAEPVKVELYGTNDDEGDAGLLKKDVVLEDV